MVALLDKNENELQEEEEDLNEEGEKLQVIQSLKML
jgi:hypothetical protein